MFASSMQNTSKLNPNAINLYCGSTVFAFIYIFSSVKKGEGWILKNFFTLSSGPKLRVAYIFAYHKLESMFVYRYTRECGKILVENDIPYSILMTQTFYATKSQVASIALKMENVVLFKTRPIHFLSVPRTPFNPSQRTLLMPCCFKMITHCSTP